MNIWVIDLLYHRQGNGLRVSYKKYSREGCYLLPLLVKMFQQFEGNLEACTSLSECNLLSTLSVHKSNYIWSIKCKCIYNLLKEEAVLDSECDMHFPK